MLRPPARHRHRGRGADRDETPHRSSTARDDRDDPLGGHDRNPVLPRDGVSDRVQALGWSKATEAETVSSSSCDGATRRADPFAAEPNTVAVAVSGGEGGGYGWPVRAIQKGSGSRSNLTPALVLVLVLVGSGCVPAARTSGPYQEKLVNAAGTIDSSVQSDLVLIDAVAKGHMLPPVVSVGTSQAADDASSATSTALSIAPPSKHDQTAREAFDQVASQAQSALDDAWIAGRRGDYPALLETRHDLEQVSGALGRFERRHS